MYAPPVPSASSMLVFSGAALVLALIPGPAVFYIVTRSASQGRRAGLVSVAGIAVGSLAHIVAAVIGLSALVVASATAFTAIKLAGAAYLVYLGATSLWRARRGSGPTGVYTPPVRSMRRIFADGVVLNILNPKLAVFFLAFVPQFVDADAGSAATQIVWFGALFVVIAFITDALYAVAAGWIGSRLRSSPRAERRKDRVAGVTYLGLGAMTAFIGD